MALRPIIADPSPHTSCDSAQMEGLIHSRHKVPSRLLQYVSMLVAVLQSALGKFWPLWLLFILKLSNWVQHNL